MLHHFLRRCDQTFAQSEVLLLRRAIHLSTEISSALASLIPARRRASGMGSIFPPGSTGALKCSRLLAFRPAWYERLVTERPFQFEWDEAKADANASKHGVTFELASTIFFDPNLITVGRCGAQRSRGAVVFRRDRQQRCAAGGGLPLGR